MRNRKFIILPVLMAVLFGGAAIPRLKLQYVTADGNLVTNPIPGVPVTLLPPLIFVSSYSVPESSAEPMTVTTYPTVNSPLIWGYEAAETNARLFAYNVNTVNTPPTLLADCVPAGSINGRGLAMDPVDGELWYTYVTFQDFLGDGYIHKTTPPNTGSCTDAGSIPFGDGPGGMIQDDIGAMDVDSGSKHLWVAGYKAMNIGFEHRSYLYLVNRNNGNIMRSCWVPFRNGGVGNDTLSFARIEGLPGSGDYLLTDAGQKSTLGNLLLVVDTADCRGGVQVTPVATFTKPEGMVGIDYEYSGLLDTDATDLFNLGGQPFASSDPYGPWGDTTLMEDISLCASKGVMNGSDNTCPY